MFNKLLSNLPFNPSLIDQVSFYSHRLKKEAGIRRVGFAFVALAMFIQIFAVLSPAEASRSCDPSNNDIIQCGFKTKQEAVNDCNGSSRANIEFRTLLSTRGISCAKLATATDPTISTNAYGNKLISVGRKPFQKPGEFSEKIPGTLGNVFWRPLSSWGTFPAHVLQTKTDDGQLVMVMFDCGNLITLNDFKLAHPQPDSDLKIVKTNQPTGEVKSGDIIDYTLVFTNKGGTAAFFSVNDTLPSNVSFVSSQYGNWIFTNKAPVLKWANNTPPFYTFGNTDAFGTPGFIYVKVRVNDNVPSGTTICNSAYLQDVVTATGQVRNSSQTQVCNTVIKTCAEGQILDDNGITCHEVTIPDAICVALSASPVQEDKSHKKFTFSAQSSVASGATIESYSYDFGDGSTRVNKSTSLEDTTTHEFKTVKTFDVSVTVKSSVADKPNLTCHVKAIVRPEDKSPILSIKKAAANITKDIRDANNTTANANDVIEYTLTTSNISDVDAKDVILQPEDLSDVLEYATLDMNTLQGGVFDSNTKVLAWNKKITIKANESVTKVFRIKVKDPIPSTPSPDTTNKSAGDLVMHNWYGNPIDIKLPGTPIKTIERTTTTLPNTGPGSSLLIGFAVMTLVGYFFARNRLLVKELEVVKSEYSTTNGGA